MIVKEKFFSMTSMSDVPDISRKKVTMCSWHIENITYGCAYGIDIFVLYTKYKRNMENLNDLNLTFNIS